MINPFMGSITDPLDSYIYVYFGGNVGINIIMQDVHVLMY